MPIPSYTRSCYLCRSFPHTAKYQLHQLGLFTETVKTKLYCLQNQNQLWTYKINHGIQTMVMFKLCSTHNPVHNYQLEYQSNVVTTALHHILLLAHLLNQAQDHTDMAVLKLVLHAKHCIQLLRPSQSEGHCRDQAWHLAPAAFISTAERHCHGEAASACQTLHAGLQDTNEKLWKVFKKKKKNNPTT